LNGSVGDNCNGNCGYTVGDPYYRTEVGAFNNSASPYGTFDQGGNVWEWNETEVSSSSRGLRGGSFGDRIGVVGWEGLSAAFRVSYYGFPDGASSTVGFRVASVVPEPAAWSLALLGAAGLAESAIPRRSSGRNFIGASCHNNLREPRRSRGAHHRREKYHVVLFLAAKWEALSARGAPPHTNGLSPTHQLPPPV